MLGNTVLKKHIVSFFRKLEKQYAKSTGLWDEYVELHEAFTAS